MGKRGSVNRVKKMFRETKSWVRVEVKMRGEFWTARKVKQSCLLSLLLVTKYPDSGFGEEDK